MCLTPFHLPNNVLLGISAQNECKRGRIIVQATTSHLEGVWQWGGKAGWDRKGRAGFTPQPTLCRKAPEKSCVYCVLQCLA